MSVNIVINNLLRLPSSPYKETPLIYRLLKPAALCCAAAVLAGCAMSPIPVAENFPLTVQKKVRSAGHWNLLSRDVVEQTVASLQKAGAAPQSTVHVPLAVNASDFERAFHEMVITELVQKGWHVLPASNAALTLSYQSQVVRHNSERPHFVPGLMTTLTLGLYALHDVAPAAGGLMVAGSFDYLASINTGGPTHTELVLTTTVTGEGRYMSRKTDVYYVEESDASLFYGAYKNPAFIYGRNMKVVAE